jgi:hypothetical protein
MKGTIFVKILFRRELLPDFSNILVFANFKLKIVLTKNCRANMLSPKVFAKIFVQQQQMSAAA